MLLKLADLGPGFTASPQSAADADDYCKALDESDLTVTGEAESPAFRRAVVSVSSAASVYESTADASASWRRSSVGRRRECAREILRREFAKQGVTLVSFRRIPFPNVAERTAAYRLRLSAEMQGTTVPLVLDLVALRRARAQVSTFFTGLVGASRARSRCSSPVSSPSAWRGPCGAPRGLHVDH